MCTDELVLKKPTVEYADDIMAVRQEILENDHDDNAFSGCGRLANVESVKEWIDILEEYGNPATCPEGKVPSSTYLAVRVSDNRIVGIIDVRHHINHPILSLWGGHIGYSIRPSERRKGYAKEMLRLDLEKCRELGLEKVMVTCSRTNTGSEKTILANGGVFENEVLVDGEYTKRFWITL